VRQTELAGLGSLLAPAAQHGAVAIENANLTAATVGDQQRVMAKPLARSVEMVYELSLTLQDP
jgi:hypothetical protein